MAGSDLRAASAIGLLGLLPGSRQLEPGDSAQPEVAGASAASCSLSGLSAGSLATPLVEGSAALSAFQNDAADLRMPNSGTL